MYRKEEGENLEVQNKARSRKLHVHHLKHELNKLQDEN